MLKCFRVLLALLWLASGVSLAQVNIAAENRAFKEAKSAFEDTIWERAERQFAEFVEKYPGSALAAEAVLYRAQALFQLSRFGEAIPLLEERKANAGSQTDRYLYWIGEARFRSQDYAAAADAFAELTRNFPTSTYRFEASVSEAEARARLGDWERVAQLLNDRGGVFHRFATNDPASSWTIRGRFLAARASLERNDPTAARLAMESLNAAVLNPEQTWQRQQVLTRIALGAGQPEQADQLSTNLVLLAGLTARPGLTAESWALRGLILERRGQTAKAVEAYSQNLAPTAPVDRQREALGKLAELHLARGEVNEAMRKLASFLDRSTNAPDAADVALLSLAELHLKQYVGRSSATNHLDQALLLLDRLVNHTPPSSLLGQAHLNRGWCYWLSNQPALSREAFTEAAARLGPSELLAVAQFKVGDAAFAMNDFAGARDNYRAALTTAKAFPEAEMQLGPLAWYQLERACLAVKDMAGAEEAMRQIFKLPPAAVQPERSLLLVAQGYADANHPDKAAALFAEFAAQFPDSALRAEVELAAARVAEQKGDWAQAVARYEAWTARFTNHAMLPVAEFYRARAVANSRHETNAFGLFTNFVARFPSNSLVPAAEYWLGDYAFRAGDFAEAEKRFSLLYHYWPGTELAAEACMMAGRAAIGRTGYREAITHFTNLTANPNCPPGLKSPARSAYGYTLRLLQESNRTNRIANLELAVGVYRTIVRESPGADAAAAMGDIGNTYYQLGTLDAQYFPLALDAYQQVTNVPAASSEVIGQALVGCGMVLERMAESGGNSARGSMRAAFNYYLDALYDEAGHAYWRKKAGMEAIRLGRDLGEWSQVEQLCARMQKLFPPLQAKLEKPRAEAAERARANGK